MKLAIISDIHSNLSALNNVLKSIELKGVDKIICLGDLVGYGAQPNECIETLRAEEIPCIMGNHDEAAIGLGELGYFNNWAREAIAWTMKELTSRSLEYLQSLDYTLAFKDMYFVHASPFEPHEWHYVFTEADARTAFTHFSQKACFVGHSHVPVKYIEPESGRMVINVGSVGQPRDRDPRACWGIYNTENADFEWIRVSYDVDKAAKSIKSAGLPAFLAKRLLSGI